MLLRLDVVDADSELDGNGGPFAFEILSGNAGGEFRISQNGDLITTVSMYGRSLPNYHLQVRVHDNGRPHLHTDVWMKVQVSKFLHGLIASSYFDIRSRFLCSN